ncbi:MAG: amidohydrolase family protein [Anaerolineales bacterium]|nr:amidohydrolase family protein [Anaerolineales bacterium]
MSEVTVVLDNATVLDVVAGELLPGRRVLVAGERILRHEPMSAATPIPQGAVRYDVGDRTVMPGLCDAHVHVLAWTANLVELARTSPHYNAARAAEIMTGMLDRGFTTVRDEAGADYGLAWAVEQGYFQGPRLLICGRALTQTGGHGDMRGRGEVGVSGIADEVAFGVLCDGVAEVRRACREEVRRGANHIKLMLSGGVASPTDRISNDQFSRDEIRAAVEEAAMADLYVTGHTYGARAVNRAIECGVRSLEHCNLIDESSIELFLKHDAFMVPTLATYDALAREGVAAGMPKALNDKVYDVLDAGINALRMAHEAGVKLAYGTDLLGQMHRHQLDEFSIRAQVQPPIDIIRAATCNAADLFNEAGETGVIAPGARADILVVDGDPLADISRLQDPANKLKAIIKAGRFHKNEL